MTYEYKFLENEYNMNIESKYNYLTTKSIKLIKDVTIKEEDMNTIDKVGKYSIYTTKCADITPYSEFVVPCKLFLLDCKKMFEGYNVRIKTKNALFSQADPVVNHIAFKLSINNLDNVIWAEPILTYSD